MKYLLPWEDVSIQCEFPASIRRILGSRPRFLYKGKFELLDKYPNVNKNDKGWWHNSIIDFDLVGNIKPFKTEKEVKNNFDKLLVLKGYYLISENEVKKFKDKLIVLL